MPKIKTHKATAKRIRATGSKKNKQLKQRASTQGHFNARDRGKDTRAKRKDKNINSTNQKSVRRALPYL
ncbi:50S ribosomal protein L35 [Patescibacteria group bacterium]|nr:50S ribosomal protein L35 [Patescibacteria group bacterium]